MKLILNGSIMQLLDWRTALVNFGGQSGPNNGCAPMDFEPLSSVESNANMTATLVYFMKSFNT